MDKWSKIFLISLSIIGFSFLGYSLTAAEGQDSDVLIARIKRDIKKQEETNVSLQNRYNNILRQQEGLKKFLEQERGDAGLAQEESLQQEQLVGPAINTGIKEHPRTKEELKQDKFGEREFKKQYPAPLRDTQMMLSLQAKDKTKHNKSVEELDRLIQRQEDLFATGKKLEVELLEGQKELKALEKNNELSKKQQKGTREK
jgi:hypothetical protein